MNESFKRMMKIILQNEGGFVNDFSDPGGATKLGVSLRFLKSTGSIRWDLDNDGDIDIEDIRRITVDHAHEIYYEKFYKPLKLDRIQNEKLALQVLDHAINAGIRSAVKILQRVSGCREDGIMGPKTIAAVNSFSDGIVFRYMQGRYLFYENLTEEKPRFMKFLNGWNNRVKHTFESWR